MATKVTLLDDLDGSEGAVTCEFSVNERTFEMELSPDNLAKLEAALEPFIDKARDTTPVARWTNPRHSTVDQSLVRTWAAENNITVSPKGRVPGWIIDRWLRAQDTPAVVDKPDPEPDEEAPAQEADAPIEDVAETVTDTDVGITEPEKPKGRRGRSDPPALAAV